MISLRNTLISDAFRENRPKLLKEDHRVQLLTGRKIIKMSKFTSTSETIQLKKNATLEDFNFWSTKYFAIANAEEFADIMTGDE